MSGNDILESFRRATQLQRELAKALESVPKLSPNAVEQLASATRAFESSNAASPTDQFARLTDIFSAPALEMQSLAETLQANTAVFESVSNSFAAFQSSSGMDDFLRAERSINEALRVGTLGKSGAITTELRGVGKLPKDERALKAAELNKQREEVAQKLQELDEELARIELEQRLSRERVDVTLPVGTPPTAAGRIHPVSQVTDEITAIFSDMGFSIAEGPDIETDWYNFTALNFPEGHPAREMHDTFFMAPSPDGVKRVLRTHTSPVQIRVMKQTNESPEAGYVASAMEPPIRVIMPGRTYRHDSDQTHTPMFHQVEGLVIDKQSHIGQLRWVLEEFFKAFFEVDNVKTRFRPSFFPFTEPSMEVDVQCDRSGGEVKIGEGSDWLEILGCGMVHPNVLTNCGLDPDVYQGFAWGMGIDRLAMLKYGMPDLRAFFDGDKRWLDHYGFRAWDVPTLFAGLSS